jgi:hypothetical protein
MERFIVILDFDVTVHAQSKAIAIAYPDCIGSYHRGTLTP